MNSAESDPALTIIGVDGGGTQTRVAVCGSAGAFYGVGSAGPGNYHNVGAAVVRDNIAHALGEAWRNAGVAPRRADSAFLGLGSVVTDQDRACIHRIANELRMAPADKIQVDHDLRAAAAGAFSGGEGIVLVAGTGSAAFGVSRAGETWRSGGWGPTIDDAGSAYWLGLQAVRHAVMADDGRGRRTSLAEAVKKHFDVADLNELMFLLDAHSTGRRMIAALAQRVVRHAADGDAVARDLIASAARDLALCVRAVRSNLDFSEKNLRIAVVGGLVKAGPVFMEPLREALLAQSPGTQIVEPDMPPVDGALLLAAGMVHPAAGAKARGWFRADAGHSGPAAPPSAPTLNQPQAATE
ncbi:Glucosamine kinase GspK [Posidoniimonas polymericola]|uniref:Glucosamine kinase GspK n=1 Tax=Posidoniimonas polymericola TaxID=2528002 RepID=A0A5C5YLB7_9BACT|nr:BadF/BadG/BcrA/BcrD ATPase family protein [Posidoniimonas polymericola]TWT75637.1 Glucosamine kinase GspK [Posidoniimonas polymericola]